jgi:hypothetical protein
VTPRYAAKTDANHAEIRDGLRELGFSVIDTFRLGDGTPDMVVIGLRIAKLANDNYQGDNVMSWWEIKDKGGDFTEKEQGFFDKYGHHSSIRVARTIEDILYWYGMIEGDPNE